MLCSLFQNAGIKLKNLICQEQPPALDMCDRFSYDEQIRLQTLSSVRSPVASSQNPLV